MSDVSHRFLTDSRTFLTQDYMPRIERCVTRLTAEQLWARSNEASNSIGNLVLHLAGSSRFWAAEVIGGAAVSDVDRRLVGLSGEDLLDRRAAHGEEHTVLWCVYHIVEHFAMHTGQILSMTKALVGALRP